MGNESAIFGIFIKLFDVFLLGILFLLGCIPVVTLVPSASALFYCVGRELRDETAHPYRDFWGKYREELGKGIVLSVLAELILVILMFNRYYMSVGEGSYARMLEIVYLAMFVMAVSYLAVLIPVFSRFRMPLRNLLRLNLFLWGRFFPLTILKTLLLLGIGIVVSYAPVSVLILPGIYASIDATVSERVLRSVNIEE